MQVHRNHMVPEQVLIAKSYSSCLLELLAAGVKSSQSLLPPKAYLDLKEGALCTQESKTSLSDFPRKHLGRNPWNVRLKSLMSVIRFRV